MTTQQCPICSTGELTLFQEPDELQYKGQTLFVEVEYAVCPHCGEEMILPDQIKRNDCRVRDAWRKAEGLLTGAEITALRKTLGLTQQDAAKMFGGGVNAFSKYERGEVIQSEGMDKLMRLALELPEAARWLREQAGLPEENSDESYGRNVIQYQKHKSKPLLLETTIPCFSVHEAEDYRSVNHG